MVRVTNNHCSFFSVPYSPVQMLHTLHMLNFNLIMTLHAISKLRRQWLMKDN